MEELDIMVSCILNIDGKKKACVRFSEGKKSAEGYIPDCTITSNNGFADDEVMILKLYMRENLDLLKHKATGLSPVRAVMSNKEE